jgi:hypothetical protein
MFTIREVTVGLITFITIVFEPILSPQDHDSHSENQVEKTSNPYIQVNMYGQRNTRKQVENTVPYFTNPVIIFKIV